MKGTKASNECAFVAVEEQSFVDPQDGQHIKNKHDNDLENLCGKLRKIMKLSQLLTMFNPTA